MSPNDSFASSADTPAADFCEIEPDLCETIGMARGWESKDVQSQVEETEVPRQNAPGRAKSAEEIHRERERQDLQLSRTRIMNELVAATHPNHRKSLEAALAHLDKKLSELA